MKTPSALKYGRLRATAAFEDNGKTDCEEHRAVTKLDISFDGSRLTFTVNKAEGDLSVIPQKRSYKIIVKDAVKNGKMPVLEINGADVNEAHTACAENVSRARKPAPFDAVVDIFSRWQEKTNKKSFAYKPFENKKEEDEISRALKKASLPDTVRGVLEEYLAQE